MGVLLGVVVGAIICGAAIGFTTFPVDGALLMVFSVVLFAGTDD